jgi:hypothetical protein
MENLGLLLFIVVFIVILVCWMALNKVEPVTNLKWSIQVGIKNVRISWDNPKHIDKLLIDVKIDDPKGKRTLGQVLKNDATSFEFPARDNTSVTVVVTVEYDGQSVDSEPLTFIVGEESKQEGIEGVSNLSYSYIEKDELEDLLAVDVDDDGETDFFEAPKRAKSKTP